MTAPGRLRRILSILGLSLRTAEDVRNTAVVADAHLVLDEAGILAGPLSDRLAALVRVHEATRAKNAELLASNIAAWDELDRFGASVHRMGCMITGRREIPALPFLRRVA